MEQATGHKSATPSPVGALENEKQDLTDHLLTKLLAAQITSEEVPPSIDHSRVSEPSNTTLVCKIVDHTDSEN
jgi:hypothetical protein